MIDILDIPPVLWSAEDCERASRELVAARKDLEALRFTRPALHEEFYVCGAAGYPDPWRCDTFEEARRFALTHEFNRVLDRKVEVTINRRVVSNHEIVWMNGPADLAMTLGHRGGSK